MSLELEMGDIDRDLYRTARRRLRIGRQMVKNNLLKLILYELMRIENLTEKAPNDLKRLDNT